MKQESGDADSWVFNTAIAFAGQFHNVIIVEDTDVLVFFHRASQLFESIFE